MRGGGGAIARKPSQTLAVLAMCVVLIVIFSVSLKGFLTVGNLFALSRNISILGILALGMAIVVIGRGLDLSQVAALGGLHRDRHHRHERRLSDAAGAGDRPRPRHRDRRSQRLPDIGRGDAALC